jgi:hypothetical protein
MTQATTFAGPNMASRRFGSLLLFYHGSNTPTDAEWDVSMKQLAPIAGTARVLVISHGGGPNAAQRGRLSQLADSHRMVAAVVSDSIPVRFIVSCIALFMSKIRCFTVADLPSAYRHLDLDRAQCELAERNLAEMRVQVMGKDAL